MLMGFVPLPILRKSRRICFCVGWVERFLRNPSTKNKRMETSYYLINRLYIDGFRTSTHPTGIKAHLLLRRMGRAPFAKPINQTQTHGNNALFDKPALY